MGGCHGITERPDATLNLMALARCGSTLQSPTLLHRMTGNSLPRKPGRGNGELSALCFMIFF